MIEASRLRCVEYFQHLAAEASATEEGGIVNPKPSANHYLPATSCSFDFSAKFHNRMMRLNTSWPSDAMTYNGQWYFNWISQFSETGCEKGKFSISHFLFLKGLKTKVYSAGRGHVGVGSKVQHWPDTQLSLLVAWNFLCFRKSTVPGMMWAVSFKILPILTPLGEFITWKNKTPSSLSSFDFVFHFCFTKKKNLRNIFLDWTCRNLFDSFRCKCVYFLRWDL